MIAKDIKDFIIVTIFQYTNAPITPIAILVDWIQ